jgi:hypothetical protein
MMVDRINDIFWQAQQGSVAAIIQLLNQRLTDSGVRTRAVFNDGILQLLCETNAEHQIEQSTLVGQIREILTSIAPRNIYRVNINCRVVREEQLLWLDEIKRDPESQLLWSEEITLKKPSIFQQFIKDFQERKIEAAKVSFPKTQPTRMRQPFQKGALLVVNNQSQPQNSAWGWMFLGISICVFFVMVGLALYALFGDKFKLPIGSDSISTVPVAKSIELQNNSQSEKEKSLIAINQGNSSHQEDYFASSVRIANDAAVIGKKAKTPTQWLELAANWQRASDLMAKVPPSHSRYEEAQIRTKLYKQYSQAAQKQADKNQS